MPSKKTNLDVLVARERDWLVDILADMRICVFCAYRYTCIEFPVVDRAVCFEGNRKWLLEPYSEDRWLSS